MEIREAVPADAAAVAAVHVGSWRETYEGIFPPDVIAARSLEDRTRQWDRRIPDGGTFVACDGGDVVGFAHVGPSRDPEGLDEVHCMYVLRSHWGAGAGRGLMRACLGRSRARAVILWVMEANARARRFYEKAGFSPDGASKPVGILGCEKPKMRYRRDRDG